MNPKISVVMSVYNGDLYLREAIESIMNQAYQDFEFIIVNDGSTDGTAEILNSYKDLRIRVLVHKNMGLAKSLNRGIFKAKGEYIARMDDDDISFPNRFEKQVEILDNNRTLGVIGTSAAIINSEGNTIYEDIVPEDPITNDQLLDWEKGGIFHGSIMFRKEALERVGYYRCDFDLLDYRGNSEFLDRFFCEDYDLLMRIREEYDIKNLQQVLFAYRLSLDAYSTSGIKVLKHRTDFTRYLGQQRICGQIENLSKKWEKRLLFYEKKLENGKLKKRRISEANYWLMLGKIALEKHRDQHEAQKMLRKSILLNPLSSSVWVNLGYCFLPPKVVARYKMFWKKVKKS